MATRNFDIRQFIVKTDGEGRKTFDLDAFNKFFEDDSNSSFQPLDSEHHHHANIEGDPPVSPKGENTVLKSKESKAISKPEVSVPEAIIGEKKKRTKKKSWTKSKQHRSSN